MAGTLRAAESIGWGQGERLIWVVLGGLLVTVVLMAWTAPDHVSLVPVVLGGLLGVTLLFGHPTANLVLLMALFAFFANTRPGLQTSELLFGAYLCAFLVHWYGGRLLRRQAFIMSPVDQIVAVFLFLGSSMALVVGVLFGAPLEGIRGDLTAFIMLFLYFPVKEFCRTKKEGAIIVIAILVWIGIYLGGRTVLLVDRVVQSATVDWQIADVRIGAVEAPILVACFASLVLLLYATRLWQRLGLGSVFLFLAGSLILTRGRTFWLAFAIGLVLLLLILKGHYRARLVTLLVAGTGALLTLAFVFFGDFAELILSGTLHRMSMIATGGQDISMTSRYVEWEAVWRYIVLSPVVGYGFGTTYQYYDILANATLTKDFIHNGYLAAWFKMGFFGLSAWLWWWFRSTRDAWAVYRHPDVPTAHRAIMIIVVVSLVMLALAANTSIFFLVKDQIFLFALLTGIASGLFQRYSVPREVDAVSGPVGS